MSRLSRWWFASAPAERLAAVRIFVGVFALAWVVGRLGELSAVARLGASHFHPVGVVRVLDAPLPPALAVGIAIATALLLVAFVCGWRYRVTAPLAAAGLLWTLTYRNAWGMVFHTENLLVLHVIALACAPAADVWSLDRKHERLSRTTPPAAGYGWALKLLLAITAVTYVLAGIAKLRIAGLDWLAGEQLRNQIAIDNLRKAVLGDMIAPLGTLFLDHPAGFTVFSIATMILELVAPIVLLGGRIGRLWALAAWSFHAGVVLLMNIWFPYPLLGLAYLPVLPAERPLAWVFRRWEARRGRSTA
jgi:hypothetical protein